MSRWISITEDHLRATAHGHIVDSARAQAPAGIDPIDKAIAGAVARVRRAVSTGNILDADTTAVPASLEEVTCRIALFALCEKIGLPLSPDQQDTKRADTSDLNRITDNRTKVEVPDSPLEGSDIQPVGHRIEAVNVPVRLTGRGRTSGL